MKKFFTLLILSALVLSVVPQAMVPAAAYADSGLYVNVEDYGANGHDDADDMDAIQRAIDDVCNPESAVYGKTVYLPAGTYLVKPSATKWIILRDNLKITGDTSATIKVMDNSGDYGYLFGAWEFNGAANNVTISDITIDQNGPGNTTSKVAYTMNKNSQYCVYLSSYENVRFDKVNFYYSGVNCLYLSRWGKDAYITNCRFIFKRVGTVATNNYDNSALYLCGRKQIVQGNIFEADLDQNARGGCETHFGVSVISGNIFDGFNTGVNIVNPSASADKWIEEENDITVTNNTIHKADVGVAMWACSGHLLSNVTIANNNISLINATHGEITSYGIEMIYATEGLDGDYDNINIVGNTIKFQTEPAKRDNIGESSCRGIGVCPAGNVKNVNIANNIIQNAPLAGIKVGLQQDKKYQNITIKNNMIIDAGSYQFAKIADYRAAIFLLGNLDNVYVEDNIISDTHEEFGGYYSIYAAPGGTYNNLRIKDNTITSNQGGYYWNVPTNKNIDFGQPFKTFYSDQFPITKKMTLNAGDIIYNVGTLTPGASYSAYRATSAGTIGTLDNVTASIEKNSDTLIVSDSSNIEPGDYINVSGLGNNIKVLLVRGNQVKINRKASAEAVGMSVTFAAPIYRAFGQLSRT